MIRIEKVKDAFSDLINKSLNELSMDLSEPATYYVIDMVSDFADRPEVSIYTTSISELIGEGMRCSNTMRAEYFRIAGDSALFIAGMYPDSLESRRAQSRSLGSYIDLGQIAYSNLDWELFNELANKFPELVDLLNTVSIKIKLTSMNLDKYLKRRVYIDARTSRC